MGLGLGDGVVDSGIFGCRLSEVKARINVSFSATQRIGNRGLFILNPMSLLNSTYFYKLLSQFHDGI
jgi:hypothetical protein